MRRIDIALLLLRVSLGAMMLLHGLAKLDGIGGIKNRLASNGIPEMIAYGVYLGEIIAPILMIIGFRTRFASLIFLLNCLVALFLVHSEDIFTITDKGAWGVELLGLYIFGSMALVFTGGGKYSISTKSTWD